MTPAFFIFLTGISVCYRLVFMANVKAGSSEEVAVYINNFYLDLHLHYPPLEPTPSEPTPSEPAAPAPVQKPLYSTPQGWFFIFSIIHNFVFAIDKLVKAFRWASKFLGKVDPTPFLGIYRFLDKVLNSTLFLGVYKFLEKVFTPFRWASKFFGKVNFTLRDIKHFALGFVLVPCAVRIGHALPGLVGLVDRFSHSQHEMDLFHDTAIILILGILVFVSIIGIRLVKNRFRDRKLLEDQGLETVWTVIPAVLLVFLALPSLRLLYLVDDIRSPSVTAKSVGHQWYWRYERAFGDQGFDSYITKGDVYRNLDVDNRLVLNSNSNVQIITTSADVIHSWAVPSLGVKMDSVPGRLNTIIFNSRKNGVMYGQCSEICGANHSFMPIVVEVI